MLNKFFRQLADRKYPLRLLTFFSLAVVCICGKYVSAESEFPAQLNISSVTDLGVIFKSPLIAGRDGGYSVRFNNLSIWFFGDTLLSAKNRPTSQFISSSCSWTEDLDAADGIKNGTDYTDGKGTPIDFFPFTAEENVYNEDHAGKACVIGPCESRWALWPGAAIFDHQGNRLLLFYEKVLVKKGVLNFHIAGHSLAVWKNISRRPERLKFDLIGGHPTLLFGKGEPGFGSAAIAVGPLLYVFGCDSDGAAKPCRLARVPFASITDRTAWEFYNSENKWQKEITAATPVFSGGDMMSVSYLSYLERYIAVYSQPMSTQVMIRTAKHIQGPWSNPLKAFDAKKPVNDIGWIYDALEHPEYARNGGKTIYISYSRQTGPSSFEIRLISVQTEKSSHHFKHLR